MKLNDIRQKYADDDILGVFDTPDAALESLDEDPDALILSIDENGRAYYPIY